MKIPALFPLTCWLSLAAGAIQAYGQSGEPATDGWPLASRIDRNLAKVEQQLATTKERLSNLARIPSEQTGERLGYHSRIQQRGAAEIWVQVDLGATREFDSVVIVPVVLPRELGGVAGYGFPKQFLISVSDDPEMESATPMADFTTADFPNPGRTPVVAYCPQGKGRYLRLTATGPTGRVGSNGEVNWPSLALAEIMVLHGDQNLAAGRRVTAPTSREAGLVWSIQNLTDGESILGAPVSSVTTPRKGWHSAPYPEACTPVTITLDLGANHPVSDVRLFPMRWEGYPHWLGFGFPVRYKVESATDPSFADARVITDHTGADVPNPGMNAIVLPADGTPARLIRITATRLWERFTDHAFALSEVQVFAGGTNVAPGATVATTSVYPDKPWANENLIDGHASDNRILPLPLWVEQLQTSARLEKEILALQTVRNERLQTLQNAVVRTSIGLTLLSVALLGGFLIRNSMRRRRELLALQQRIARDLHDEIGSNLAGISLLTREASHTASPPHRRQLLDEVGRVAEETAASMRDLVWLIQPGVPGDLINGMRQCASRLLTGMTVVFVPPEEAITHRVPLDLKRQIYLVYKEALQNVARHSQATSVLISFVREGRKMLIRIKDDGVGLPTDADALKQGNGLENMRQRVRSLRGEIRVFTPEEGGCEVEIRVPWPE